MTSRRSAVAALVLAPLLSVLPAAVGAINSSAGAPPATTFRWESQCDGVSKIHTGRVRVPTRLDVCGTAKADVVARLATTNTGGAMEVSRLAGAPASMALRLEAVFDDPRAGSVQDVAFGFDATSSSAPASFSAALTLSGSGSDTAIGLGSTQSGAGSSLGVVAEIFTAGAGTARLEPQRVRLGYAPVPSAADSVVRTGSEDVSIQLGSSSPTAATLVAEDLSGLSERRVNATVDQLPSALALGIDQTGSQQSVTYQASAPIDALAVEASDPNGLAGRATNLDLRLEALPTQLSLDIGQPLAAVDFDAGAGSVGTVEVLLSDGGTPPTLPADEDGVVLVDTPTTYAVYARGRELAGLRATQRPAIDLLVDSTAGRDFRMDLAQQGTTGPAQTVVARILSPEPNTHLAVGEVSGGTRRLDYVSSGPAGLITIAADNLAWEGRARNLDLALSDVPSALTLDLGNENGSVDLDASGAEIGRIDLLLTSGPTETIPAGVDGLVAKDIASHYAVRARISGLRRVNVSQNPLDVDLDATSGNAFRLDVREQGLAGGRETFTVATFDTLQRNTNLSLEDTSDNVQRISYSAGAPATSLVLETNAGQPDPVTGLVRTRLSASIAPLPSALATCFAAKPVGADASSACGNPARPSAEGSFRIQATQPAVLNLFDCTDNNFDCSSPESQLRIMNLSVRSVELNLETGQNCSFDGCLPEGSSGNIWLDTDNLGLTGSLFWDDGGEVELSAIWPAGFRANDRFARWSQFVPVETTGSVTCPSGTDLDVELYDTYTIDVAGLYLC